ncbi:hypothetical protein BMIN_0669 [Bifidobacterium minimum]|uniref:Uncharacterized protein n=1 Tax=Bifidobacterium minimum TaxID=1693 RepID=A0A087BQC0_9BIFI|nr:hypothetical protein BMIN_0669 [Bifidobacterium minimum]
MTSVGTMEKSSTTTTPSIPAKERRIAGISRMPRLMRFSPFPHRAFSYYIVIK